MTVFRVSPSQGTIVDDSFDAVGAFTVTELTGDKRTLRLVERALPYRPFDLEGEQDSEPTKYAGNPVRSIQVFGPSEKDTTIKGFWKDIFVGDASLPIAFRDGQTLSTVKDLAEFVDDVREKGQRVEVTWLHHQRQGIVKRFKQSWHNLHDLEWEITFEWSAKSKNVLTGAARAVQSAIKSASALASSVTSQMDDFVGKAQALDPSSDVFTSIAAKVEAVNVSIQGVQDASNNVAQSVTGALQNALGMAGYFQGAVLDAGDIVAAAYSRAEAGSLGLVGISPFASAVDRAASTDATPPDAVGSAIAAAQANRDVVRSARQVRFKAAHARDALVKSAQPNLLAAFVARDNQDLRDVSLRFYGTADGWRRLMAFNDLRGSKLGAGDVVFVPRSGSEVTR